MVLNSRSGMLYATMSSCGDKAAQAGTLLMIDSNNQHQVTVLHTFGATGSTQGDGSNPQAPLLLASNGNVYGSTPLGGKWNFGTIFVSVIAPYNICCCCELTCLQLLSHLLLLLLLFYIISSILRHTLQLTTFCWCNLFCCEFLIM